MAVIKIKQKDGSYEKIKVYKGKSAYETACDYGFKGTEDEWLESLRSIKEEDVLTRTNTTEYTPAEDYNPATKKYVDDAQPKALFEIPTDGALKTAYVDIDQITTPGIYYSNKWGVFSIRYKDADNNTVVLDSLMRLSDSNNQYMEIEVTEVNTDTIKYNYVIDQVAKYFTYDIKNKINTSLTNFPIKYFENVKTSTKTITVELGNVTEPGFYLVPLNKYGNSYNSIYFKLTSEDGAIKDSILLDGGASASFPVTIGSNDTMQIGIKECYITYKVGATKDDCIWKISLKSLGVNNIVEYTPAGDYNPATKKYVDDNRFSGSYNDLTDTPEIPSIDGLATEEYVDGKVSGLVNSAPETLDTLKELADALGNDNNFATTVTNSLADKANNSDVLTKTNTTEYTPTEDYHPSTKKYTDKVGIPIFHYDIGGTNNNLKASNINLWELEIGRYRFENNLYRILLQCKSKNGTNKTIYISYNTKSDREIYVELDVLEKNSKYMIFSLYPCDNSKVYYKYTFATDSDEYKYEKIYYILTTNNTVQYTPTEDYHPTTKKYVDDLTSNNQTTDEDINSMLTDIFGGDYIE